MIPQSNHYWLKNAHIPVLLLEKCDLSPQTPEGLALVDLEIEDGKIKQIIASEKIGVNRQGLDLEKKLIFPCFVDIHTHLDKGHIWQRSPNLEGTFENALVTVQKDSQQYWTAEDVYKRMEFGLKCSYAHGTRAIRTHIDSYGKQAEISLGVFQTLQQQWQEKIILQAVSLVALEYYQTPEGIALADKIAEIGGILGGVAYINPELESQLDHVFSLAQERGLDLDFHVDENGDSDSVCLLKIAETALKTQFKGSILCGHCCSLSVQSPEVVSQTLSQVKAANIAIASLPMCNLYLQDRQKPGKTPYWRGITKVHEFKAQGIPIAFASDNCRDPFYGFGDHDVLEVLTQAVRIAHLDTPYGDWCCSVTKTPAELMKLPHLGRLGLGLGADLIIFKARYFSELFSRPQWDRIVLHQGQPINTQLPDYSELDNLMDSHHSLGLTQRL